MRANGVLPPTSTSFDPYDDVPNFGRIKKSRSEPVEPVVARSAPVSAPITPTRERLAPAPMPAVKPVRRTEPRLD